MGFTPLKPNLEVAGGSPVDVRSMRVRRGASLCHSRDYPQPATRRSAGSTPLIEFVAVEVELAAGPVLVYRNRPLGCELPKRVAMDVEVGGGAAGVHPVVCGLVDARLGALHQTIDDQIGEQPSSWSIRAPSGALRVD